MIGSLKNLGTVTALMAMVVPHAAFAQDCVAQQDVNDAVVYAFPLFIESFEGKCGDSLSPTGFLATGSDDMVAAFTERQDAAWPGTLRLINQFTHHGRTPGEDKDDSTDDRFAEILDALPESVIRPFFDAIVMQKITEVIPMKDCGNIERGLELVAPLPPENIGGLAAFMFEMTDVKNPDICPYETE